MVHKIDVAQKYQQFNDYWNPRIVGQVNQQEIRIAKIKGAFDWHQHDTTDELFLVTQGTLLMDFRDHTETVHTGELIVVPKGIEHRPRTLNDEEVHILMIEASGTLNTGNVVSEKTRNTLEHI